VDRRSQTGLPSLPPSFQILRPSSSDHNPILVRFDDETARLYLAGALRKAAESKLRREKTGYRGQTKEYAKY
jgi:hypothetical protein